MKIVRRIYLGLILIFLYAPIAVLIIFSFNDSKFMGRWGGFTLKWYSELFQDPRILKVLYYTLLIALLSSLIATVIGTFAAIGIQNMPRLKKKLVMGITNIPVLNPDIVTGVSLMLLYVFVINIVKQGSLGFTTMLLSHITFNIPFVVLSVLPKLKQFDNHIYEAALDLGAKPLYALRKVIFPEILPGVIAGFTLSFTMSIDDFVVSFFTTGSGVSNLSIYIYSMTKKGINPKINALSTLLFLSIMLLLYLLNIRDQKYNKKGEMKHVSQG